MARSGRYNILLAWYDSLGGIDTQSFTAYKSYGYDISNVQNSKRDIFNDWDSDFITGIGDSDTINIEANERIIIRSQDISLDRIDGLAQIKLSPAVFDGGQNIKVNIDRSSFVYRKDDDKRHSIQFFITYPDLIIPTL